MSENEKKLRSIFSEVLHIPEPEIHDGLAYEQTTSWDSVAHMSLIAALDSNFNLMIDTDDVIDMSSYSKARKILTKYGVSF